MRAEVDPAWEITSVARQVFLQAQPERRYALLFERVRGYSQPVVVGALAASPAVYAAGLGVAPSDILERWATALRAPVEPRLGDGGLPGVRPSDVTFASNQVRIRVPRQPERAWQLTQAVVARLSARDEGEAPAL